MRKCYLLLFVFAFVFSKPSSAQCPSIIDALANACTSGSSEGINEFVIFTTSAADTVGAYTLYYGTNTNPTVSPTGVLPGSNATTPTNPSGIIKSGSGCNIHQVTSSTTVIPANSTVLFIAADFDTTYDVSEICTRAGGDIYVTYIDRNIAPSKWATNGNLANSPTTYRYLQMRYAGDTTTCTSVRRYINGWGSEPSHDGDFLTWSSDTDVVYTNSGCTNIVTPIRLLSFTGQLSGKNANLFWQTATEINSKSFVVEWSSDGVNFTTIGTVAAAGNSNVTKSYSKVDYSIPSGVNFYRLKTIDVDGRVSFSSVVRISNAKNGGGIKIYTDAAGSLLNLEFTSRSTGTTHAVVYDYVGRVLAQRTIAANTGVNRTQLNVSTLPKGGYVLKLISNGQSIVTRFVKQ